MTHRTARRAAPGLVLSLAVAGCMAVSSAQGSAVAGGASPASTASREGAEQRVAELVNRHRAARGCPALVWDDGAARVAAAHSRDMAARSYFSHTSPDGRSPFDRLDAAGIRWSTAAENIAQDPRGPDEVVRGWLASPGHRANIENCTLTRHGVGVSGQLWTHLFYTPAPR
ncbi:MAG: Cysteine-rich secretory protein family protein [Gemmatimonadetes bacterium]|nr:Cysteine-rich secretory protein family protein [Gemmatimonadota bacterium]